MSKIQLMSITVFVVLLAVAQVVYSAPADPGDFSRITIEVDDDYGTVTVETNGDIRRFDFPVDDVHSRGGVLEMGHEIEISSDGMLAGDILYPIENLAVDEVYDDGDLISVVFKHRKTTSAARRRKVKRNRIAVAERLIVEYDDFVRGEAICFGGNVEVEGEVNRNVVALFGDVYIRDDGIVRQNVVAVDGRVHIKDGGAVYGEILAHRGVKKGSRVTVRADFDYDRGGPFQFSGSYNRVEGLRLGGRYTLSDPDSVLPALHAEASYAFEAGRWRYSAGAHQRLFEEYSFTFGGRFFRQTSSDDHWLSPKWEPTALAILAAEDPLDYYEEEGGQVYFTFCPGYYNELGISYGYTSLGWMDHHPKLWSLFGWDKEFRANFSSVPADERVERLPEFESKLGQLTAWYNLDTRDDEEETHEGWWANLEYQTGGDRLKGDHAFDRFTAEVRRYQPITYRQNVNARIKYGTSGRDLPMFREFYLGGMRTVRGLDHKSLRGEQMFLANLEYVLYFPRHSFETALLFDVGAVGSRDDHLFSDGDFHSSIGFRVGLEEGLSIEVAKSLDESEDSLKLWVLFQRSF